MHKEKLLSRRDFLKLSTFSTLSLLLDKYFAKEEQLGSKMAPDRHSNVILLVFDSLSARHLPLYGYKRKTTPNLERFAQHANVYHRHYAGGNFTIPGTASLLTGTYPWTHRALQQAGLVLRYLASHNIFADMEPSIHKFVFSQSLWADILLRQFDADIDVHLNPSKYSLIEGLTIDNLFLKRDQDGAFRAYEDFLYSNISIPGSLYFSLINKINTSVKYHMEWNKRAKDYPLGIPNSEKYELFFLVEQIFSGIESDLAELQEPFFSYLHLYPPHEPYNARSEFIGMFDDGWQPVSKKQHPLSETDYSDTELNRYRREYDEYIANLDFEFGKFYEYLSNSGLLKSSYVILTSDHGQLFERGVHGHTTSLMFDPVIHIPLMISAPGQVERQDIYSLTSCVDILPTVLHVTGRPIPAYTEGKILPGFGGHASDNRAVFAIEAKGIPARAPLFQATLAILKGNYKLIRYIGYPGYEDAYEMYNLIEDPEELDDIYASQPEIAAALRNELYENLQAADEPYRVNPS